MVFDKPYSIHLETPYSLGGTQMMRQLVCECVITGDRDSGPRLIVNSIKYACGPHKGEPIAEIDLPTVKTINEAAQLHDWALRHKALFIDGKVVNI